MKLFPIKSLYTYNVVQVTVTGVKVEVVEVLVELIYKGICNLEQVLQYSFAMSLRFPTVLEWQPTGVF